MLNQIIDSQRPINDKIGLGYNQRNDELGSSSKTTKDDKKSYMDIVKEILQEAGTSKHQENDGSGDKHNSFIAGMLLQFINPKGILYGITVTSTFILTSHSSYFSLLSYSIVLALIGFMGTFSWCLCGSLFKKMISKYRSQFNILMGLLLVYCGVSIVIG